MPYTVFISASPEDFDLVADLTRRLDRAHIGVAHHEADERRDLAELRAADELIALVTERALEDQWLVFEMGAAASLRKPVTQVVVGMDRRPLPFLMEEMPHVRYGDLEQFLSGLSSRAGSTPPRARAAAG